MGKSGDQPDQSSRRSWRAIQPALVGSQRTGDHRRKLWDQLEERFPLAYNDLFARYISGKISAELCDGDCSPGERVEPESPFSGWRQRPDANHAGDGDPYGEYVQYPGYSSPSQLLDPETNINIGTSYLQYVYQQFGNNRFASAAYNAGPAGSNLAGEQRRANRCGGVYRETVLGNAGVM
jgi:hypothetical protein